MGLGFNPLVSGAMSGPNLLAFVFAASKRPDSPVPGTLFSSLDPRRSSRIPLGRRTCAGLVGKGVEAKMSALSSSGLSWRRRNEGLLVSDRLRSASGVVFVGGWRDVRRGVELGELIAVAAWPRPSQPQPAQDRISSVV